MISGAAISVAISKRRLALFEALSFFQTEWTRDHLLGKMPAMDAAILSSPLQRLHACSFDNDLSFDPVDQGRSKNNCSTIVSSEAVMVRAYTKHGINVGYCLSDTAGLSSHGFMDYINGAAVQNFIIRERDGLYVGVVRHPHSELLLNLSCENRTKRFYCFIFPRRTFSNLVGQGSFNVTDLECVLGATIHFQYVKDCLICDASSPASCYCTTSLSASKAPQDLPTMKNSIDYSHLVHAKGTGMFEIFASGVLKITTRLIVNVKAVPRVKHEREKRFVHWAVACALKNTCPEVSRGVPPAISFEYENGERRNWSQSKAIQTDNLSMKDLETAQAAQEISKELCPLLESLHIADSLTQPNMPALEHPTKETVTEKSGFSDLQINTASVFSLDSLATKTDQPFPTQTSNCRVILPKPTVCSEPAFPLSINFPSASKQYAAFARPEAFPVASHRAAHILPCPSGDSVPDEESVKEMAEQLRQWRAYHRKIRNRESAMRSNMRKQRMKHAPQNERDVLPNSKEV